jgi:hypothetical protein
MPISEADRMEWAGARSKIVKPVTSGDCEKFPCFQCLCIEECKAGRGCTVRAGVGWCKRTPEEIAASCAYPTPTILGTSPNPWVVGLAAYVGGAGFGQEPGLVVLKHGQWWGGPGETYPQPIDSWGDGAIWVSGVNGVSPPTMQWLFVFNKWGKHNDPGRVQGVV